MITALWGSEKSWKTTMALSWPKPLFHFDLDVGGFERAAWRLDDMRIKICEVDEDISKIKWSDYDIVSKSYSTPIQMEKLMGAKQEGATIRFPRQVIGYKEVWRQIVIDFVAVVQSPAQSIVGDSGTQWWFICHTSMLQEKQEIQMSQGVRVEDKEFRERLLPVEYPNDRMRSIIYTAKSYNKNLILTHYPRNIYKKMVDKKGDIVEYASDEIEPDGFKDTQRLVDIVIWVYANKDNTVGARITKCGLQGLGTAAVGLEIDPSYDGILQLKESMS